MFSITLDKSKLTILMLTLIDNIDSILTYVNIHHIYLGAMMKNNIHICGSTFLFFIRKLVLLFRMTKLFHILN